MSDIDKQSAESSLGKAAEPEQVSRRDFFNEVAAGALGVAVTGATIVTIKYLSPNVLFEPPTRFRVGAPDDFPIDSVTYFQDQKVFIVRTKDGGFFAETAVCTHLGCIVEWDKKKGVIHSPCHDGLFNPVTGAVIGGPPPRPIPPYELATKEGKVYVGKPLGQIYGT